MHLVTEFSSPGADGLLVDTELAGCRLALDLKEPAAVCQDDKVRLATGAMGGMSH